MHKQQIPIPGKCKARKWSDNRELVFGMEQCSRKSNDGNDFCTLHNKNINKICNKPVIGDFYCKKQWEVHGKYGSAFSFSPCFSDNNIIYISEGKIEMEGLTLPFSKFQKKEEKNRIKDGLKKFRKEAKWCIVNNNGNTKELGYGWHVKITPAGRKIIYNELHFIDGQDGRWHDPPYTRPTGEK